MYLTVDEAAQRYKVTKDCIWRWVRADKFPKPVKLNGATRWRVSNLESWEKMQEGEKKLICIRCEGESVEQIGLSGVKHYACIECGCQWESEK